MPIRVPAYNGYGAEDDLYAMGLKLQPAISSSEQEQYRQFMTSHDRILRFKAKVGRGGGSLGVDLTNPHQLSLTHPHAPSRTLTHPPCP